MRFGTAVLNRIILSAKHMEGNYLAGGSSDDFFILKRSHSVFLFFTIHVALNVNIRFLEKSIASLFCCVVYLRTYLGPR